MPFLFSGDSYSLLNAHFRYHLSHEGFQETSVYPLIQLHCTKFFSDNIFHIWFCTQVTFRHIWSILPDDSDSVFYLSFSLTVFSSSLYILPGLAHARCSKNVIGYMNVNVYIKSILWLSNLFHVPFLYKTHFCFSPFCLLLRRIYLKYVLEVCRLDLFWKHFSTEFCMNISKSWPGPEILLVSLVPNIWSHFQVLGLIDMNVNREGNFSNHLHVYGYFELSKHLESSYAALDP